MSNPRMNEIVRKLTHNGGLMDYATDDLHLLVEVVRALAKGLPVTATQVGQIVAELGTGRDEAERFLRKITERDDNDNIVGALGLSLKHHRYRFTVNGIRMTTWCAQDTLFLPAMLQQSAIMESESPLSKERIRLIVSPKGVQEVGPVGTVMSIVVIGSGNVDSSTATSIQMNFCRHVHFFASQAEAEQWVGERNDIEILSLEEAYDLGCRLWPEAYAFARTLSEVA